MKIKLTKDFRIALNAGTVITVDDNYAETLKALGVAETVTATRKKAETVTATRKKAEKADSKPSK